MFLKSDDELDVQISGQNKEQLKYTPDNNSAFVIQEQAKLIVTSTELPSVNPA